MLKGREEEERRNGRRRKRKERRDPYFLVVDNLTREILHHLLLRDTIIVNLRRIFQFQSMQLSTNRLQESTAPRARPTQHNEKLTAGKIAIELIQNPSVRFRLEAEIPDRVEQHREDCLLELQGSTRTGNRELLENNTRPDCTKTLLVKVIEEVACPLVQIELVICRIPARIILWNGQRVDFVETAIPRGDPPQLVHVRDVAEAFISRSRQSFV